MLDKTGQLRRPDEIDGQPFDRLAIRSGNCGERAPFVSNETRITELLPAVKRNGNRKSESDSREEREWQQSPALYKGSDCGA